MVNRHCILAGALLCWWAVQAIAGSAEPEPPPSAVPAKVITSGRTTTAVDIKIVKIGQQIPKTYAREKIHNTPGFEFYVSQHYALKSSRGDDYSRMMLEVAELAYPHLVELVGAEPPDPDTRMYFVCAKNGKQMIEAMKSDIGMGTAGGYGGGITIVGNRSAYNYESGTLKYHQRALVMHENLHMLQMIVHGTGGSEGFTYSFEQHVYDPHKKQLTVICFDKPTVNNYTDDGLRGLRQDFVPLPRAAETLWNQGGGPGVIYTQFLWRDPDRWLKWCIWRDEYYAGRVKQASNTLVMEEIFGPLHKLERPWETWIQQRRNSFHYVEWGWEQDGNALWAYGFPKDRKYWSQTDVNYAPNETVEYDRLRMDYPAEPMPALVGPVKRGVAEPSVGYLFDFSRGIGCWGGLGLGVDGRSMCMVVLKQGTTLIIDGSDFGIPRQEVRLLPPVIEAAAANGLQYGVTMQINPKHLDVTVRAGKPEDMHETKASAPINSAQRDRLLTRPMALVGNDGYPTITPFIDDARKLTPDLTTPAAANFWRFEGMDQLATLYKAIWRLRGDAPQSLLSLKADMLAAVDGDSAAHAQAIKAYEERIATVVKDVRSCAVDSQVKALALGDLTGTAIFFRDATAGEKSDRLTCNLQLIARLKDVVTSSIELTASPAVEAALPEPESCELVRYRPKTIRVDLQMPKPAEPVTLTATVKLHWRDQQIVIPLTKSIGKAKP